MARPYRMKIRADRLKRTRSRIVEAAVDLHTTIGPAHTADVAVARKAGVTRVTLYRHFPDDRSLFRACMQHGLDRWPPPDPEAWRRIAEPQARLSAALAQLYAYYRVAGPGLVVIARDAPLLRRELLVSPSRMDILRSMPAVLLRGWKVRGRRRRLVAAALHHAVAVRTWQTLVREQGLADGDAVELLVGMVLAAQAGSAGSRVAPRADTHRMRAAPAGFPHRL